MKLTDIADKVAAQVPLCPLPLVLLETRWAVKEFLKESRAWSCVAKGAWRETEGRCAMVWPDGAEPAFVYAVRVDGHEIDHMAGDSEIWPRSDVKHVAGPRWWRFVNGSLELFPVVERSDEEPREFAVEAVAALTIEGRDPDIPCWIDPDDISFGAMGKLFGMAGQPWSNPSLGVVYEDKFGRAVAGKRIERMHGGRPGTLTVQAPYMGGYF